MCSIYSAGSNACGQLAHGSEDDSHAFKRCLFHGLVDGRPAGSKIISIAAGANHTLLLLRSQEGVTQIWGCGNGQRGQLGAQYLREFGASSIFRRIIIPRWDDARFTGFDHCGITLIAASWETSYVVLAGSDYDLLLSVGGDDFGDLGVGGLLGGKKETDTWREVRFGHLLPKKASKVRVAELKAGPHSVIAKIRYLDTDMREAQVIVGWGAARQGQLGQGPTSKKVPPIFSSPNMIRISSHVDAFAAGSQHTVFLTSESTLVAFGSNRKGQLSGLDGVKNICAVAATWNGTYLLRKHENANRYIVLATGSNSNGQLALASDARTPTAQLHEIGLPADAPETASLGIICGSEHVLLFSQSSSQVLDGDMDVYTWGWNEHGNLGLGHTLDIYEPARIQLPVDDQRPGRIVGVWAGCATTWIAVRDTLNSAEEHSI